MSPFSVRSRALFARERQSSNWLSSEVNDRGCPCKPRIPFRTRRIVNAVIRLPALQHVEDDLEHLPGGCDDGLLPPFCLTFPFEEPCQLRCQEAHQGCIGPGQGVRMGRHPHRQVLQGNETARRSRRHLARTNGCCPRRISATLTEGMPSQFLGPRINHIRDKVYPTDSG